MDFDSGDLILISALSFTDEAEYVISVIASDDSVPPQTDMTTVIVNVVDVNNKGPVFIDNSVTAALREGNYTTEIVNVLNVRLIHNFEPVSANSDIVCLWKHKPRTEKLYTVKNELL